MECTINKGDLYHYGKHVKVGKGRLGGSTVTIVNYIYIDSQDKQYYYTENKCSLNVISVGEICCFLELHKIYSLN